MASLVCCPCRNICLHLERVPTPQEMPFWLSENFKLSKGIGKATLVAVPGVTKVKFFHLFHPFYQKYISDHKN